MEKAICPEIFPGKPRGYPALFGAEKGLFTVNFPQCVKISRKFSQKNEFCASRSGKNRRFPTQTDAKMHQKLRFSKKRR